MSLFNNMTIGNLATATQDTPNLTVLFGAGSTLPKKSEKTGTMYLSEKLDKANDIATLANQAEILLTSLNSAMILGWKHAYAENAINAYERTRIEFINRYGHVDINDIIDSVSEFVRTKLLMKTSYNYIKSKLAEIMQVDKKERVYDSETAMELLTLMGKEAAEEITKVILSLSRDEMISLKDNNPVGEFLSGCLDGIDKSIEAASQMTDEQKDAIVNEVEKAASEGDDVDKTIVNIISKIKDSISNIVGTTADVKADVVDSDGNVLAVIEQPEVVETVENPVVVESTESVTEEKPASQESIEKLVNKNKENTSEKKKEEKKKKLPALQELISKYISVNTGLLKALKYIQPKFADMDKNELTTYPTVLDFMEKLLCDDNYPNAAYLAIFFGVIAKHGLYPRFMPPVTGSPLDKLQILDKNAQPVMVTYPNGMQGQMIFAIDNGPLYGHHSTVRLMLPVYDISGNPCLIQDWIPFSPAESLITEFDKLLKERVVTPEMENRLRNWYVEGMTEILKHTDMSSLTKQSISKNAYMELCRNLLKVYEKINVTGKYYALVNYRDPYNFKLKHLNSNQMLTITKGKDGEIEVGNGVY